MASALLSLSMTAGNQAVVQLLRQRELAAVAGPVGGAIGDALAGRAAEAEGGAIGEALGGPVGGAIGDAIAGVGPEDGVLPVSGPEFNEEVDRRFYAETDYETGKKLDPKRPEDAPYIKIWLQIRDLVRAERLLANKNAAANGAGAAEAGSLGAAGAAVTAGAAGGAAANAGTAGAGAAAQAAGGGAGSAPAGGAAAGAGAAAQTAGGGVAAGGAPAGGAAAGAGAAAQTAGGGVAAGGAAAAGAGAAAQTAAGGQAAATGAGAVSAAGAQAQQAPPQPDSTRIPDPAQTQTRTGPTPDSAASGINWDEVFSPMNVARGAFEIGRLVPVAGLASGVIADSLQHVADMQSLEGVEVPEWMETLITLRNAVNLINNAIGHVMYVDQLVQDGLIASVEFAPFASITATVNEIGEGGKLVLDGIQLLLDVGIIAGAEYQAMQAPPGSDAAKKWEELSRNYAANVLGDMLTTFLDVVSLATGGASQSGGTQAAAKAARPTIQALRWAKNVIPPLIQSWWNIYGGNVLPEGVSRTVAFAVIENELQKMKAGYIVGDFILDELVKSFTEQTDQAYAVMQQLMGGRDPFLTLRDASVQALNDVQGRIGQVASMADMAGTAQEKADWIRTTCEGLIGRIDGLQVPSVEFSAPELGEGALADVAEGVLGAGAAVANQGLELLVDQIRAAVETAKDGMKAPISDVQSSAVDIAQFMQILQRTGQQQMVGMQAWVATVGAQLAQCTSFEQVMDLAIGHVMDFAGIEGEFHIDDMRQQWRAVGTTIDEAIAWAASQGQTPAPGSSGSQNGPRAATGEPPEQPQQPGPSPVPLPYPATF